ncbi:ArsR/SmtB family transcription factor [Qipengyuania thermophila]|uniref:ArsR/SmtB family transcription factor n=1 Tax=Qipengyuania thermophila TaxID=2509361 RepID=UPI0028F44122|nr:helix-turn-helix domain-containing protein [Qipengyuania thermophila]
MKIRYFHAHGNVGSRGSLGRAGAGASARPVPAAGAGGEDGLSAGTIASTLGLPNSSLSFHLAHLVRAGLAPMRREGRSLNYSAGDLAMNALVGFLLENCCGGAACGPALAEIPR